MTRMRRPRSLTVIAWVLIIFSLLYFVNASSVAQKYFERYRGTIVLSLLTIFLWLIITGALGLVSGVAILRGLNWGRLLCLCYMPVSIIGYIILIRHVKFVVVLIAAVVAISFYVAIAVFLTRPAALTFFTRPHEE